MGRPGALRSSPFTRTERFIAGTALTTTMATRCNKFSREMWPEFICNVINENCMCNLLLEVTLVLTATRILAIM